MIICPHFSMNSFYTSEGWCTGKRSQCSKLLYTLHHYSNFTSEMEAIPTNCPTSSLLHPNHQNCQARRWCDDPNKITNTGRFSRSGYVNMKEKNNLVTTTWALADLQCTRNIKSRSTLQKLTATVVSAGLTSHLYTASVWQPQLISKQWKQ